MTFKYYLGYENNRNALNQGIYIDLLKAVFGGHDIVVPGHHFVVMPQTENREDDVRHMNEIPSADTILTDHDIMRAVFGESFLDVIIDCVRHPTPERDECLRQHFLAVQRQEPPDALALARCDDEGMICRGDA
jgi:hypothetical protein